MALDSSDTESPVISNSNALPSLSDQLSKQVRVWFALSLINKKELNKKLLAIEQEKEKYENDIQSIKQLLCQEMRVAYDEHVAFVFYF